MKSLILFLLMLFPFLSQAQETQYRISGRVRFDALDQFSMASGITVKLIRQGNSTTTDSAGNFVLFSTAADTLVLITVGYHPMRISVDSKKAYPLHLTLASTSNSLQEVSIQVNTGFQTLPKERATGSFTVIDQQLYNEQVGTDVLERLKYITNGLSTMSGRIAGGENKIMIRGMSTLSVNLQKPLIVLDNFEYAGNLENLNPNQIESINFLKDAAAGSIWGAKAANGVIVITTKKGKFNQKVRIDLTSNISITAEPDLSQLQLISSGDLIAAEKYLFSRQYRLADSGSSRHLPFTPAYELMFKHLNGTLNTSQLDDALVTLTNHDVRQDFSKFFYAPATAQQYALSLNGGSAQLAWTLAAGIDKNISELKAGYNKLNLHFANTFRPVQNLSLSSEFYFTTSNSSSGAPPWASINTVRGNIPVYTRFADDSGNALPLYHSYREGYTDQFGEGKLLDWKYYPLNDYQHGLSKTNIQDLNAVFGVGYQIFNWFTLDVKYRYERQQSASKRIYDQQSYFTRNLVNDFTQLNPEGLTHIVPLGDILDRSGSELTAQNLRGQANFNWEAGDHGISAIAGAEASETINTFDNSRVYGWNQDSYNGLNVNFATPYPTLLSGTGFIDGAPTLSKSNTRFLSFYGNGAYTYKTRYSLSASLRRDASNLFGVSINDKWKPLWSTGLSWDVSKESFYGLNWLSFLKLSLTYGRQGNIDPSKVAVLTLKSQGVNNYTGTPINAISNYPNDDLKWEQVDMLNAGLDFSFAGNRITGSIAYYRKYISDLYGPSLIDLTSGLGTSVIVRNVGKMNGKGLDFQLNTQNTTGVLRWSSSLIVNTYTDKIIKLTDPNTLNVSAIVGQNVGIEGKPSYFLAVYRSAGLDPVNGDPRGYIEGNVSSDWQRITTDGSTMADIRYIGRRSSPLFGSIGNTLSWKKLSLSARVSYKFGYWFQRGSINYTELTNTLNGHSDFGLRWQKAGDENITSVPSFTYPDNVSRSNFYENSETLVTRGDHIRLQYINLGYQLKRFRLSAIANNIGILWTANHLGLDPDYAVLPPQTTYSLSLNFDL